MKNYLLLIILSFINFQVFAQDKISASDYETLLLKSYQQVIQIEKIKNKKMEAIDDAIATRSEMIKVTCQVEKLAQRQLLIIDDSLSYPKVEKKAYQKEIELRGIKDHIENALAGLNRIYKGKLQETCKLEG